jgi:hypothetical protein
MDISATRWNMRHHFGATYNQDAFGKAYELEYRQLVINILISLKILSHIEPKR